MAGAAERTELLYREHGPAICAYLRRWLGDRDTALDLLQETFLQAMRHPERLEEAASPRAWLFGIARNLCRNDIRRRRPTADLPDQLAEQSAPADPRLQQMRGAIAALPARQREALQLRLREELSYEEIASVLQIPVGTVRSRLHNAVRRLREALSGPQD